jgi:hypothetical protein
MAGANALRRRDTTMAFNLLSQSVALGPASARARTALATLTLSRGDTAAAIRLLRTGVAMDPTVRVWRTQLRQLGDTAVNSAR